MKISVIVPVYNAEKYISRCVDSILKQIYSDWELLLVDDGSKDGSLAILNDYAKKDCRIKVFHQENAGAGAARNVGLDNAIGEYIVFIDSDDFVESDYFGMIVEKGTDVVFVDVCRRREDLSIDGLEKLSVFSNLSKNDIIRNQMTGKMLWGGVRKAVKSDIIRNHLIRFSKHKVGEEAIYSFLILFYSKTFSFIDKPVYSYVLHDDSLSQTLLDDPWGDVALNLKLELESLGLYDTFVDTLNAFFVTAMVVSLDKMVQKYSYFVFRKKASERIMNMKKNLNTNFKIDVEHIDKRALVVYNFVRAKFFLPVFIIAKIRHIV